MAYCNYDKCTARVAARGGAVTDTSGYQLEISRESVSGARWMVTLIARGVPQPDQKSPAIFAIPGHVLPVAGFVTHEPNRFGTMNQTALEAIFPALRQGSEVKLSLVSKGTRHDAVFSLSGLAAVLLWIDEYQDRVDDSALVIEADGGDNENAPLSKEAADNLREELARSSPVEHCEWNTAGESTERFHAKSYSLGNGYSLYIVVCTPGAYQPSTMVFVRGIDIPEALPFADYSTETGWTGTLELGFVDFDPKTWILQNYEKYRGAGDCGSRSKYLWTGHRFKLLEFAYKDCTDEAVDENANIGEFPIIYKAE